MYLPNILDADEGLIWIGINYTAYICVMKADGSVDYYRTSAWSITFPNR